MIARFVGQSPRKNRKNDQATNGTVAFFALERARSGIEAWRGICYFPDKPEAILW